MTSDFVGREIVVPEADGRQALADAESQVRQPHPDLLVVGGRGRGGFTGMVLGSTGQALIYHAPCPVLVVRAERSG